LFFKKGELHILLTQRTHKVSHHKGQISFPGGKFDPASDRSIQETALRETWEEVGIEPEAIRILGQMQAMPTLTEFLVYPLVGIFPEAYPYRINPGEIATLIEVPLKHLLDRKNQRTQPKSFGGKVYQIYYFDYLEFTIWGITGHLLYDFLNLTGDLLENL